MDVRSRRHHSTPLYANKRDMVYVVLYTRLRYPPWDCIHLHSLPAHALALKIVFFDGRNTRSLMNLLPAEVIFPRFKKCQKAQYLSPIDFHGRSYLKPPIKLISNRDNNTEIFLTLSHVITSRRFLFHFFFFIFNCSFVPVCPLGSACPR